MLATNKLGSICGTSVSSATYYRRIKPDPRVFGPMMASAFAGSLGGAFLGSHISDSAFDPIVLVVLVVVGAYVVLRPDLGESTILRYDGRRHLGIAMVAGLLIGCYDGALGPGTGSFFVISLVAMLGYSFLEASAKARLANWATNLAALCVFIPQGAVAVEGRLRDGCLQPRRRLRRCQDGGGEGHAVRPDLLHRGGVRVRHPDRRRAARAVVTSPRSAGPPKRGLASRHGTHRPPPRASRRDRRRSAASSTTTGTRSGGSARVSRRNSWRRRCRRPT